LSLEVVAAAVAASNPMAMARTGALSNLCKRCQPPHNYPNNPIHIVHPPWHNPIQLHHNRECNDNGQKESCIILCLQLSLFQSAKSMMHASMMMMIHTIHSLWTKWIKTKKNSKSKGSSSFSSSTVVCAMMSTNSCILSMLSSSMCTLSCTMLLCSPPCCTHSSSSLPWHHVAMAATSTTSQWGCELKLGGLFGSSSLHLLF